MPYRVKCALSLSHSLSLSLFYSHLNAISRDTHPYPHTHAHILLHTHPPTLAHTHALTHTLSHTLTLTPLQGMESVQEWFRAEVQVPMMNNGIIISLRTVEVNNTLKKPGPVFLGESRGSYVRVRAVYSEHSVNQNTLNHCYNALYQMLDCRCY